VAALAARGIVHPFDIQRVTIPDALAGRDVCGRAPTGSGKTIAFGLPLVARVGRAKPRRPRALVLAPTRELAAQIQRDLEPLARARGRTVLSVYGGVGYEPQRRALRRGVDVLVACPGRLLDLVDQRAVDLGAIDFVVVDEADRMSDMGFLPSVRKLLAATAPDRQTLLFSATLDGDVAALVRDFQRDPARHEVGSGDLETPNAEHTFWRVERNERVAVAASVLAEHASAIVFVRTRRGVDRAAEQLGRAGLPTVALHGGHAQNKRDRALASFTRGTSRVLVATDVAARGIHVDGVECVIHFDVPEDAKTYVHRSGRTARAGADGRVLSFVADHQVRDVRALQRSLGLPVSVEEVAAQHANGSVPTRTTGRPPRPVERPASSNRAKRANRSGGSGRRRIGARS
jgi:superfamily II DNA/RNA helicase